MSGILKLKDIEHISRLAPGKADDIVDRVKTLSKDEQRVFIHGLEMVHAGRKLNSKLSVSLMPIVDKLDLHSLVEWSRVYSEARGKFWHPKVQEHYRRWKLENPKGSAVEWAKLTRGSPGKILRRLFGRNFDKVVLGKSAGPKALRNIGDIPRPSDLTQAKERELIAIMKKHPERLNKKLEKYYKSDEYSDSVVNTGHFYNAKGNIGEIFGLEAQLDLVEHYRLVHANNIYADRIQIISDLRVKGREFTDDIIGYVTDNGNLRVLAMTEIKNHANPILGIEDAKEQFFSWLEHNLEEGTEISFTYTNRSGRKIRGVAIYSPGKQEKAIRGIYKSEKYIIYAPYPSVKKIARHVIGFPGKSSIGMDFDNAVHGAEWVDFNKGNRTVGSVQALRIKNVTTETIDYLAQLAISTKGEF